MREVLRRHHLGDSAREVEAGFNPTYPTFLVGDVVVKLFGGMTPWRGRQAAERAAHDVLAADPGIRAPRLLAEGRLYDDEDAPWPSASEIQEGAERSSLPSHLTA